MEYWVPPRAQRFLVRSVFAIGVFLWTLFTRHPLGVAGVRIIVLGYLAFSAAVYLWDQFGRRGSSGEKEFLVYLDILFVGFLIYLTGGSDSEFYLLLYFILALRAPFVKWTRVLSISAGSTVVYITSILSTWNHAYWFDLVIRGCLFWFLALLLRIIARRSIEERERAERLARELAATHDEVRRYTAALEKANAIGEKRLAEITILHEFLLDAREVDDYEKLYDIVFKYVRRISDAPWIFLLNRRNPERGQVVVRSWGNPPAPVVKLIRSDGLYPEFGCEGLEREVDLPDAGKAVILGFAHCHENRSSVTLILVFPEGQVKPEKEKTGVLSAFMHSVESELELHRLGKRLVASNESLSESNSHLMRLQEFQFELSRAFLSHREIGPVIQGIQEIMAKELFELDRLNLFMPNWGTGMLECKTSVGIENYPQDEIKVPMDDRGGAISRAFRDGKTIYFDGNKPVPPEYRLAEPYSRIPAIRSRIFVIVPLLSHEGKVVGVIGADRKYTHRPIPSETINLLEFFARHVAMVLSIQMIRD